MSILSLLACIGKKVSLTLNNGHCMQGRLQLYSNGGVYLEEMGQILFIRYEEIQSCQEN